MSLSLFSQSSFRYLIREYSWWSTHPSETAVIAFILFTILTITLSIMIVYLTQPLPKGMIIVLYMEIISNSILKIGFLELQSNFQ
jgi:hypothetical protein